MWEGSEPHRLAPYHYNLNPSELVWLGYMARDEILKHQKVRQLVEARPGEMAKYSYYSSRHPERAKVMGIGWPY
jgi:hypothetical protein